VSNSVILQELLSPPGAWAPSIDLGGTVRQCQPEITLERIRPLFSKVGITRIARVTGLDNIGISVSLAIRPLSRSLSVSQGKGFTRVLADVSAAMEAIEHYHAENPPSPGLYGSFNELKDHYEMLDSRLLIPGEFPAGVDLENSPSAWLKGIDLLRQCPFYVPHYVCSLRTDVTYKERLAVQCTSNGLASGNTAIEATLHALYEVIERDATASARSVASGGENEVDVGTIVGSGANLIEMFLKAGISVRVWDQTTAIGIPSFRCSISGMTKTRVLPTFLGFGTHLSRQIALCRALTEAAQSRLTVISGARDDVYPWDYMSFRHSAEKVSAAIPTRTRLMRFEDCPDIQVKPTLAENLSQVLGCLERQRFSPVIVVDMSKPAIGIPVVWVIVPGLRYIPE